MSKYKISIIEDDEITAMNLKLSLQKQGYEIVSMFDNVEDALANIAKNLPHLFVIDISLNESNDGIELAKKIKEKYFLPFIYLTSHSTDEIIEQAKRTKPYGYIVKPFQPNSLHAAIQMALFQHESEQEAVSVDTLVQKHSLSSISFSKSYQFNLETNELFYHEQKIDLKEIEAIFIKLLIVKLGVVVTFEEATLYILQETQMQVSIRTLVWRLRNKLSTEIIQNASGIGYYIEN